MAKNASATFETTNRKLENFLYMHDIEHTRCYRRPEDDMTVWVYYRTPELSAVVEEYLAISRRRAERRNAACVL